MSKNKKLSTETQYDSFVSREINGAFLRIPTLFEGICIYGCIEHRKIPIAIVDDKILAEKILVMLSKEVNK